MRQFPFLRLMTMLCGISFGVLAADSQLIINEIMQSNITYVFDDLKEYPDSWVELYNAGDQSVNLGEYSLGIKEKASKAYTLPEKTINPGEFVMIFCDKVGTGFHSDFRLESGKNGLVSLFHNGTQADVIEKIPAQPAPDTSYGRLSDGENSWGYQLHPTPGRSNAGGVTTADRLLQEPEFSHSGGIMTAPVKLTISIPEGSPAGTVIRYSLDCSEVTESAPVYDGSPIDISKSTIIRARLFCDGYLSPFSSTHSYIFHHRKSDLPLVSLVSDNEMFYSEDKGILTKPHCYKDYRRPVNVEYFENPDAQALINQLCETRTGGGWTSRNRPQKTLMVYANKRFGKKRLDHEFFPDQRPGVTDFKSLMIRNAGNDYDHLFLRDAAVQRNIGMNLDNMDWQADRLCVLYINGVYQGLRHIRERSNEDNVYTNHDGLEDIDMVENWEELKEGSLDSFIDFRNFYNAAPVSENAVAEYNARLDTEEFLDTYLVNLFYLNIDWPGNNFILWRPSDDGGRWRSILKDMDWIIGFNNTSPYSPHIKTLMDAADPSREDEYMMQCMNLFRNMMSITEFRQMFVDHALVHMADFLNPEHTVAQMESLKEAIMPEWEEHRKVAEVDMPLEKYNEEYAAACDWLNKRYEFFYTHLADYFSLGDYASFKFVPLPDIEASYNINGVGLHNHELSGKWPVGRELLLKSDNPEIDTWTVIRTNSADDSETTEILTGKECQLTIPAGYTVTIEPGSSVGGVSAPSVPDAADNADPEYFNLSGSRINASTLTPGVYICRRGTSVTKVLVR